jgi:hypothetical protein
MYGPPLTAVLHGSRVPAYWRYNFIYYGGYLKIELEIARSKLPQRVTFTPQERNRLVKFGAKLGRALDKLVTMELCQNNLTVS